MNFDDKIKRALGKKSLPKFNFPKTKGASLGMQKKWASFNSTKRNLLRKTLKDSDGDRVPDRFDCKPFNVMEQGKPNRMFRKRIENLPIYYGKSDSSIKLKDGNDTGFVEAPIFKTDDKTKRFNQTKRKIQNVLKRDPYLIQEIESRNNDDRETPIIFTQDPKLSKEWKRERNMEALATPGLKSKDSKVQDVGVIIYPLTKKKSINPRTITHELKHTDQFYEKTPKEYKKEDKQYKKFMDSVDKGENQYFEYPTEYEAEKYAFKTHMKNTRDLDDDYLDEYTDKLMDFKNKKLSGKELDVYAEDMRKKSRDIEEQKIKENMEDLDSNQVDMEELRDDILECDLD